MKILAIGTHLFFIALLVASAFTEINRYCVNFALGAIGYYSFREIKAWWEL